MPDCATGPVLFQHAAGSEYWPSLLWLSRGGRSPSSGHKLAELEDTRRLHPACRGRRLAHAAMPWMARSPLALSDRTVQEQGGHRRRPVKSYAWNDDLNGSRTPAILFGVDFLRRMGLEYRGVRQATLSAVG